MIAGACALAIAACPYVLLPALVFLGVWSLRRARDRARQEAREHNERTDNMRSHLSSLRSMPASPPTRPASPTTRSR